MKKVLYILIIVTGIFLLLTGSVLLLGSARSNAGSRMGTALAFFGLGAVFLGFGSVQLKREAQLSPDNVEATVRMAAHKKNGEVTAALVASELACTETLVDKVLEDMVQRHECTSEYREGVKVYLFESLKTKLTKECPYCGNEYSIKTPIRLCPTCGGNLEMK